MKRVIILGAGPAGMSCALWLKNLGCRPVVLEREPEAGGLLRLNVLANDWVLGQDGMTGTAMAGNFAQHFTRSGIEARFSVRVETISPAPDGFRLTLTGDDTPLTAAALVVATGTRVRGAEWLATLPGSETLPTGHLWVGPSAFGNIQHFHGKQLLVVGGGDNAHEFVRLTAPHSAHQTMLVRNVRCAQTAQRKAVDMLVDSGQVSLYEHTAIAAIDWQNGKLLAHLNSTGAPAQQIAADMLVLQLGYTANSEEVLACLDPVLRAGIQIDNDAYWHTDPQGQTGIPGVYAIGDICNRNAPCVVTALAAGATTARAIEHSLQEYS